MKRILIIDDDTQLRQMLRQLLERQGHEVADAPDGKEAIKLHKQFPADLIITDIIMPEKEGVETIIELMQDFPDVKIVAISGGSRAIDAQDCLSYVKQLGVEHTFTKPFEHAELLDAINDLLGTVPVK